MRRVARYQSARPGVNDREFDLTRFRQVS